MTKYGSQGLIVAESTEPCTLSDEAVDSVRSTERADKYQKARRTSTGVLFESCCREEAEVAPGVFLVYIFATNEVRRSSPVRDELPNGEWYVRAAH